MKNKILQDALTQFMIHGIREMSNQKLVELLGISTKTIYKYFKNKEELLEKIMYLHHQQQLEMLKSLPVEKNAGCVFFDVWHIAVMKEYGVNNTFFEDLTNYYPELDNKIRSEVTKKYTQVFIGIIKRGMEEGAFRKDIFPEVVLENVFLQHVAIARTGQFKRFRLSPENIMFNTITTTIRGVCTVKGAEILENHIHSHRLSTKGLKTKRKDPVKHSLIK